MKTILVKDFTSGGMDFSSGTSLLNHIESVRSDDDYILLDFSGVDAITTAFMNGSIGAWIIKNNLELFKNKFKYVNLSPTMWQIIRNYVIKQFESQKVQ
jgi:STAS-like domain of unknown function (DUF4325)